MDEDLRLAAIEASKLFKKGKYEDAVDICTLGISDFPQYSSLYLILAKSYIALGNVSEAHKVFESASKFFVNDPLINTLKDILEATPTINSEPSKKKTQQLNDTPEVIEESQSINSQTTDIEESNSFSPENLETDTGEVTENNEVNNETVDEVEDSISEEFVEELMLDENVSFDKTPEIEDSIDTLDIQTDIALEEEIASEEFSQDEEYVEEESIDIVESSFEEITPETEEIVNEEIVDENELVEEEHIVDEEESELDDVLSGFDQMVSTIETEEFDEDVEVFDEETSTHLTSMTTTTNSEIPLFSIPTVESSSKNFIKKIRTSVSPIDVSQFSFDKQQFLTILPSVNEFSESVNKVHHIENFHLTLENPLQDTTLISTVTNEPMQFDDTYDSHRRNNADIVIFDHSVEGLESIDAFIHLAGKKA